MNLKVESTVLHLRNLIEFFYPTNPRKDDVMAEDYIPDWRNRRPTISPLLEKARERAGKELAHLTTKRITGTPAHKAWEFDTISADLKNVAAAFIALNPNITAKTISQLQDI